MSRVAKAVINVPKGLTVDLKDNLIKVKGSQGALEWNIHNDVQVEHKDNQIHVAPKAESTSCWALAGTTRALINNMVVGCDKGFEKKLTLIGVGYRAQAKGKVLNLNLGFSHPIDFELPEGITVDTPSQTEIVVKGSDKQKVGQVAAKIRSFRPPEPYKGKGVRYADENVVRKETKKK